jgi:hypothetical protein
MLRAGWDPEDMPFGLLIVRCGGIIRDFKKVGEE